MSDDQQDNLREEFNVEAQLDALLSEIDQLEPGLLQPARDAGSPQSSHQDHANEQEKREQKTSDLTDPVSMDTDSSVQAETNIGEMTPNDVKDASVEDHLQGNNVADPVESPQPTIDAAIAHQIEEIQSEVRQSAAEDLAQRDEATDQQEDLLLQVGVLANPQDEPTADSVIDQVDETLTINQDNNGPQAPKKDVVDQDIPSDDIIDETGEVAEGSSSSQLSETDGTTIDELANERLVAEGETVEFDQQGKRSDSLKIDDNVAVFQNGVEGFVSPEAYVQESDTESSSKIDQLAHQHIEDQLDSSVTPEEENNREIEDVSSDSDGDNDAVSDLFFE